MRFSLFQAWLQNKQTAMHKYFPELESDRTHITTKWMEAGSRVASGLEQRPLPDWLSDITPADISEYRIIEEMEGMRIRGTLDKYYEKDNTVIDNKSLKRPMTAKEEAHLKTKLLFTLNDFTTLKNKFGVKEAIKYKQQLTYYQVLVEQKHGKVNPTSYIEVIYMYEDMNGLIRRTGEPVEMIPVIVNDTERAAMKQLMITTAKDISTVYQAYLRGDIKL